MKIIRNSSLRILDVEVVKQHWGQDVKTTVIIPAYNEAKTIGRVISKVPRSGEVEIIVINDGSTDNTARVAEKEGARVISFNENKGLAQAYSTGLETALKSGAQVIVSIDADGQYDPEEIPKLVDPIIRGDADIVLGSRFMGWIEKMPIQKKIGNRIATAVTNFTAGTKISDAQTGFRAFSREAAMRLNIMSNYTYTQEVIIQAINKNLKIIEVPCKFMKRQEGKSRLIMNIFDYAKRSGATIIRTVMHYKALKVFLLIGMLLFLSGFLIGFSVLVNFLKTGHVYQQGRLFLSVLMLILGSVVVLVGLLADSVNSIFKLQEEILYRLKKEENE